MKSNKTTKKSSSNKNFRANKNTGTGKGAREADQSVGQSRCDIDQRTATDSHLARPNDWRWYAQNEQLVRDYASYPFGTPLGNRLATGLPNLDNVGLPGVMALHFVPSIGVATAEVSPINVAMRRLYSFVRHANSGASNYDAPDLMLYMVCVDSALMFHAFLKRAYGVLLDYTAFNRYYPSALIKTMGIDIGDLQKHINDFRGYINQFALKVSQLWMPNSMSYTARHIWMCEGVYVDSLTEKAQTYLYVPDAFYKFTLTEGVGSATLANLRETVSVDLLTYDDLVAFGDALLNPMIANEDFGIMSGDILKAFGRSGIIQVMGITDTYQVVPVYSEEVLSQIENTTFVVDPSGDVFTANITQETAVGTGWLKCQPTVAKYFAAGYDPGAANRNSVMDGYTAPLTAKKILNLHHSDVQATEVMVATRNISFLKRVSDTATTGSAGTVNLNATFNVVTCGSEIFKSVEIVNLSYRSDGSSVLSSNFYTTCIPWPVGQYAYQLNNPTKDIGLISCFDWHPGFVPFIYLPAEGDISFTSPYGIMQDFDFYTTLDVDNVSNMHLTALLSELTIPQIG